MNVRLRGLARLFRRHSRAQTFDLHELRRHLATAQAKDPEVFKAELEPYLDQLEAKYGKNVPMSEIDGLRQVIPTELGQIEKQRQEIIERGAKEGKTVEIDALRQRLEASKAAYTAPDRDGYALELDRLLDSLVAKYGNRIPVDEAYKIMRHLETDGR